MAALKPPGFQFPLFNPHAASRSALVTSSGWTGMAWPAETGWAGLDPDELTAEHLHAMLSDEILARQSAGFPAPASLTLARRIVSDCILKPLAIHDPVQRLAFPKRGWIFELRPWSPVLLSGYRQSTRALLALAAGPISRERFFSAIWAGTRFQPAEHDALVTAVLARLQRRFGIGAAVAKNEIRLTPDTIVITQ